MNAITPTEPYVRPAICDDAESIARVHVLGWREAYAGLLPQHVLERQSIPDRYRMWEGLLRDPLGQRWHFVVVDPQEGVVGFAGAVRVPPRPYGPTFKIPFIYVLKSHWRRGLGRKLMLSLGQAMEGAAAGEVALWSLATNQPARRFYESIGGRLQSVLAETDRDSRVVLAGYRWPSATSLVCAAR